ncbi:MAG: Gfo/Idh/MocA family oxidoreductase [Planctomycetota bacterium]|nr:Gfo/Idh/MocA family oxidoreductase [Planctomycetota bacterium]
MTTSAVAVAGAAVAWARPAHGAFAGGDDVLRVALIGCGSRGTGAAAQALQADANVRLTAMADAFEDRLELSLATLQKSPDVADKVDVAPDRRFVGFDAYQQAIDSGVDVVLLTSPPHFRPIHLKAAVAAGKHVFAEKPVAVDAPGVRDVLATAAAAKRKNLSLVSGLCLRYDGRYRETVARLHNGAIGDIHTLIADDYRGPIWVKPRQPGWSDMTWQMRNWYYFKWLSGDFNVEQHVHNLDVCAWVMGGYPTRAVGMGGRQVRTGDEFGDIFDHHSVTYEYDNGARIFSNTRQQAGCFNSISTSFVGTKGHADLSERRATITGAENWRYDSTHENMYQVEHDELFASIRSGRPINNGDYMAYSTLLAIMGRMATYTGKQVTWEQALNSTETLAPDAYAWDASPPKIEIALPGLTGLA